MAEERERERDKFLTEYKNTSSELKFLQINALDTKIFLKYLCFLLQIHM